MSHLLHAGDPCLVEVFGCDGVIRRRLEMKDFSVDLQDGSLILHQGDDNITVIFPTGAMVEITKSSKD